MKCARCSNPSAEAKATQYYCRHNEKGPENIQEVFIVVILCTFK